MTADRNVVALVTEFVDRYEGVVLFVGGEGQCEAFAMLYNEIPVPTKQGSIEAGLYIVRVPDFVEQPYVGCVWTESKFESTVLH